MSKRKQPESEPEEGIIVIGFPNENQAARIWLEICARQLRTLRSRKARHIADDLFLIADQIGRFHWQAPKKPWN